MAKKIVSLDLGETTIEVTPVESEAVVEAEPEVESEPEVEAEPEVKTGPVISTEASKIDPEGAKFVKAPDDDIWLMCTQIHCVYDPYTQTRFDPGVPKFVTRMGSYTKNQLEAGLLKIVPAPAGE